MLEIAIVVAAVAAWLAAGLAYGEILIRRDRAAVMAPAAYSRDEERMALILSIMLWPVFAVIDALAAVRAARRLLASLGRRDPSLDRGGHPTRG